jgi:uncharacterized membrane protein
VRRLCRTVIGSEVVLVNSKRASVTIPMPVDDLFARLCHVEAWPSFFEDLESVQPLGHRRYRWKVHYARHEREVDVVFSIDPRLHRIAWKHLTGPAFDGVMRLTPVGAARTLVDLTLDIEPSGFVEGVIETFGPQGHTGWAAQRDMQRLRDLASSGQLSTVSG